MSRMVLRRRGIRLGSQVPTSVTWSLLLWAVVAVVAVPLLWAILTSFKPDSETQRYPPTILPETFTFQNYFELFRVLPFGTFYLNTIEVAALTSLLTIALSSMAAYSMARFRNLWTEAAGFFGLAAYMVPAILIVVPVFRIAYGIGAIDSLLALVTLYAAFFLPLAIWQLRAYFAGIPPDIEEAAMTDGATRFEAFYLVILPQALPGLIATGILCFAVVWNEYLFSSLLLVTPAKQTLSAGLSHVLIGKYDVYSWGALMAACVLMTLPLVLVFTVVQRQLVAGLSSGAVKG